MSGAHLAPVAAAIEEAECSDPECGHILRDTIAEMKGAETLFARLLVHRKGAKLIEPFNDTAAIDRLSDVAINEFGHHADDVQTALAHGFKDAHEGGSNPTSLTSGARLRPIDLPDFLALDIKPREMLLDPIIPEKGLVMLYAARGTGKTHVGLGIARAVSTGTKFLRWSAPKARSVLLVDGEMAAVDLRDRLRGIVEGSGGTTSDGLLRVLCGDLIADGGVGDFGSTKVQMELDPHLAGVELLILDNLSSLTNVLRDNDADSWNSMQSWLVRLRRRGVSVLIIHHAGKNGEQRGTSRREDVIDTSIVLRHPADYVATEGARFEVHIVKGRGIRGEGAKPFEAILTTENGAQIWTMRDVEDAEMAKVRRMLDDGMSQRDIADETGIPKSTIARWKLKFDAERAASA